MAIVDALSRRRSSIWLPPPSTPDLATAAPAPAAGVEPGLGVDLGGVRPFELYNVTRAGSLM